VVENKNMTATPINRKDSLSNSIQAGVGKTHDVPDCYEYIKPWDENNSFHLTFFF